MVSPKIAIIAGHSNLTAGKRSAPFKNPVDIDGDGTVDVKVGEQYKEHSANVGVCVRLNEALLRCGFRTHQVGWDDDDPSDDKVADDSTGLSLRQRLVREAGCDASFSVHFNAHGNGQFFTDAKGVCTYAHCTPSKVGDSMRLARLVQARLVEGTKQYNRGVHCDYFAEVNCQAMNVKAAVLVELAFMTNQWEAENMMANTKFWTEAAEEMCKAACDYYNIKYVEPEDENVEVKEITAVVNGTLTKLKTVNVKGENFVRLRDLDGVDPNDPFVVRWDAAQQVVIINTK